MSIIRITDGFKTTTTNGTIAFARDKLVVPPGVNAAGLEFRLSFVVNATDADANGIPTADQARLLEAVRLTFQSALRSGFPRTSYDKEKIVEVAYDAMRTLERDIVGGVGVTTGLGKALTAGVNRLPVVISMSLGHVEFIDESRDYAGFSPYQLLDSELTLEVGPNPIQDTNAVLTGVELDLRVIPAEKSEGDRESLPPEVRTVKGGDQDSITGPEMMTLSVEDTNAALANTAITKIAVKVGKQVVTTSPATPADVYARYERAPDTGAVELQPATRRTPLYLVADAPLKKLLVGAVNVAMDAHDVNMVGRVMGVPLLAHEEVMGRIARRAEQLKDGKTIHAVTCAVVSGFQADLEQTRASGWEYFEETHPKFHNLPGLRCRKGETTPYVYFPTGDLARASAQYRLALSSGEGSAAAAAAVIMEWLRYFPGGTEGSKVAQWVRDAIVNAPAELQRRQAGKAA
ncbi:hypothetical protein [Hyalangium gracile]|uniref:hypothetical protein n=1 Tax=Hyalangium gracile TaxID=394092 RepID=UPI001CCC3C69|nr:hypothetical protein [Hyalangium gracile]